MKMIRAIIRPDKSEEVVESLAESGHVALTKMDVIGRGKQKGIQVNEIYYDELPKTMLMIVAENGNVPGIIDIINKSAYTGNFGDGKIFITDVESAYIVRTGTNEL